MKQLIKSNSELIEEGRWDIDYHLPAEKILLYPEQKRVSVSKLAIVSNEARDPSSQPENPFLYIDIASVDVTTGIIVNPQELTGEEAPSRARMVVKAGDVIVSTVRPTRGAIAVVPAELDIRYAQPDFAFLDAGTE